MKKVAAYKVAKTLIKNSERKLENLKGALVKVKERARQIQRDQRARDRERRRNNRG